MPIIHRPARAGQYTRWGKDPAHPVKPGGPGLAAPPALHVERDLDSGERAEVPPARLPDPLPAWAPWPANAPQQGSTGRFADFLLESRHSDRST